MNIVSAYPYLHVVLQNNQMFSLVQYSTCTELFAYITGPYNLISVLLGDVYIGRLKATWSSNLVLSVRFKPRHEKYVAVFFIRPTG